MRLKVNITPESKYLTLLTYSNGDQSILAWEVEPNRDVLKVIAAKGASIQIININQENTER